MSIVSVFKWKSYCFRTVVVIVLMLISLLRFGLQADNRSEEPDQTKNEEEVLPIKRPPAPPRVIDEFNDSNASSKPSMYPASWGRYQSQDYPGKSSEDPSWNRTSELIAGGIFLLFALIFFSIMGYLMNRGHAANTLLRTFTIPLICFMAVLLVFVGYDKDQITPVIGLLGSVVGYLLGKTDDSKGAPVSKDQSNRKQVPQSTGKKKAVSK